MQSITKFLFSLSLCFGAALIGSMFTMMSVSTWYAELLKPTFAPPNWLFAPVWNLLYFMMTVAFYLVLLKSDSKAKKRAVYIFYAQLLLNVLWSAVFFGLQSPLAGVIVIAVLIATIVLTIKYFKRISPRSALLLYPYLLWVCFASYLNYSLWRLN